MSIAKSITGRIVNREEHAGRHYQMGNLGSAPRVMVEWINTLVSD